MTAAQNPPRATAREWIGLAVLALPCLLYSMDLTVLHLAIPAISTELRPSSAQLLWIIDIYGFLVAGSLITMGTLGDRIGRRKLLFIGAGAFGVASVAAAFSTSAEMLIVTRALLGVAGATLAPSTLSLLSNMFLDPKQRTTAIAVWITSYSVGGAIGPLVGGVLLEYFWWGSVFLIGVPVMVLLLAVGPFLLPEYRDPNAGRPDVVSLVLSLAAVLTAIYGLKKLAQDGIELLALVSLAAGLVLGAVFVLRQLRLAEPLLDLRLFRNRAFTASLATYGSGVFIMFGGFLFLPQFLQLIAGLSPLEAGLWTLPWALAFIVGSMVTPNLAGRFKPSYLMGAGLAVAAVGFAVFAQLDPGSGFWEIAIASVIFALGFAPLFTLTIDLVVSAAPPEKAGAASAISETSAEFGGAMGIAVFGSIGLALYRSGMSGAIPEGVSTEDAAIAKDTLGGAIEVASLLPADIGAVLSRVAADSFLDGMRLCAALSFAGSLLLAGFVVTMLRDMRRPSGGEEVDAQADEGGAGLAAEPEPAR